MIARPSSLRRCFRLGALLLALACPSPALATVTSSVSGPTLSITSTADDAMTVTCSAGNANVNGAHPTSGPALCATISFINGQGGPGPNAVDLSGFDASFAPFGGTSISGGAGND